MCDIRQDEIERLVELRGDLRRQVVLDRGYGHHQDANAAWSSAAVKVEKRIVEALGGVLTKDLDDYASAMAERSFGLKPETEPAS